MGGKISFDTSQKRALSSYSQWVFVYFPNSPSIEQLNEVGIDLRKGFVYKNVYKLFLTPKQISFLQSVNAIITPIGPNDKPMNISQIEHATQLYIKVNFPHRPEERDFKVLVHAPDHIIVETQKPLEVAKLFCEIEEVEFVCAYIQPISANNVASGFTQKNAYTLETDSYGNTVAPRYLESKGITGKNVTVALLDTGIDYYNTLFYDTTTKLIFNNFTNHRFFTSFFASRLLISNITKSLQSTVGGYFNMKYTYDSIQGTNSSNITKAYYSSIGPTVLGVIKPNIVAPGSFITSANYNTSRVPNHGSTDDYENDLFLYEGTSMATPNAAGAAALIAQYLEGGNYLGEQIKQANALLLRSLLVASASRNDSSYTPDCYLGHGLIDLSTVLPFEGDNFGLRFTEYIEMTEGQNHHIGKIKVTNSNTPLRIVLSSYDKGLNEISPIAIYYDLDLIVVSPSKKIYIGNNRINDTEHYTLNEKVIVQTSELEQGEYEIHVITKVNIEQNDTIPYVVSVVGPFTQTDITTNPKYIIMTNTTECISSDNGECNNGLLKCKTGYTGQLCNIQIEEMPNNIDKAIITLKPNTLKHLKISPQPQYDELYLVHLARDNSNLYSYLWDMGSPDNYIPVLANNAYSTRTQNTFFSSTNILPTLDAKKEYYYFIHNNYPEDGEFLISTINKPHQNGSLCFCNNNECSLKDVCELQNTYSSNESIYGILTYLYDRVTYIDKDIYMSSIIFLAQLKLNFELLNKNVRHLITFTDTISLFSLAKFEPSLVANNLDINFIDNNIRLTNTTSVFFKYMELRNVTFVENSLINLDVNELIIDYESYNEQKLKVLSSIKMNNSQTPIPTIKLYNNYIEFIHANNKSKKINLIENLKIEFFVNYNNVTLDVKSGQNDKFNIPNGVEIIINVDGLSGVVCNIDSSIRDKVSLSTDKPHKGLTTLQIVLITVGCALAVAIIVVVCVICIKRKKNKELTTDTVRKDLL
ncbi:Clan SB, family S8 [Histomonas meleagridis]|uniref:Clan SB, family S8 n=1 Tax=Histomonas meleagridis TaxID=135588 RepID=UPI003559BA27|nr:Clan SB, family S8 [Histomonas meleagridis]KAH0806874.1 Clan SB, family S8 [Histomonas meleagridis]